MADVEIIIKIPEEAKRAFDCAESNDLKGCYYDYSGAVGEAIKNGTPLPKGHGKIGDLDAVMNDICASINEMTSVGIMVDGEYLWGKLNDAINNAQPIIEAENENEKEPDAEQELE